MANNMTQKQRKAAQKYLQMVSKKFTNVLEPIRTPSGRMAWRSKHFLVQEFKEDCGTIRLSVNRARLNESMADWAEGISWDELMDIKSQCGYGDKWAVEVHPPDDRVVNVANMRHLFLLDDAPIFAWKKEGLKDEN